MVSRTIRRLGSSRSRSDARAGLPLTPPRRRPGLQTAWPVGFVPADQAERAVGSPARCSGRTGRGARASTPPISANLIRSVAAPGSSMRSTSWPTSVSQQRTNPPLHIRRHGGAPPGQRVDKRMRIGELAEAVRGMRVAAVWHNIKLVEAGGDAVPDRTESTVGATSLPADRQSEAQPDGRMAFAGLSRAVPDGPCSDRGPMAGVSGPFRVI